MRLSDIIGIRLISDDILVLYWNYIYIYAMVWWSYNYKSDNTADNQWYTNDDNLEMTNWFGTIEF